MSRVASNCLTPLKRYPDLAIEGTCFIECFPIEPGDFHCQLRTPVALSQISRTPVALIIDQLSKCVSLHRTWAWQANNILFGLLTPVPRRAGPGLLGRYFCIFAALIRATVRLQEQQIAIRFDDFKHKVAWLSLGKTFSRGTRPGPNILISFWCG